MPSERTLRVAAAVLALIGIGVATYIAIAEFGGGTPPKCLAGCSCETLRTQPTPHLAGINVAAIDLRLLLLIAAATGDRAASVDSWPL
jgi:disulfide bond formation protein DsbB